jgi:hypothetical protein
MLLAVAAQRTNVLSGPDICRFVLFGSIPAMPLHH